jgi:hypothetical protein
LQDKPQEDLSRKVVDIITILLLGKLVNIESSVVLLVNSVRRSTNTTPAGERLLKINASQKLTEILLDDLEHYPEAALKRLANAHRCMHLVSYKPYHTLT